MTFDVWDKYVENGTVSFQNCNQCNGVSTSLLKQSRSEMIWQEVQKNKYPVEFIFSGN